jgi:hypothetical protein
MRSVSFVALTLALVLPMTAGAQFASLDPAAAGDAFTLSVDQQYPAPYSQATLSFLSGTVDITNATLTISVNGKETYKGAVQRLPVTLGGAGSVTVVKATVVYQGATYSKSVSIQPQEVVVIIEPIASVPPLYPGKPSVPPEGGVRLVAIANLRDANGKAGNASTYSYSWTVHGVKNLDSSGIGKSSIIVQSPLPYRDSAVSVDVKSPDGKLVGGTSLTFFTAEPSVRVYENDPLLGIRYDHALNGTYAIRGAESTLYAAPFSFPITNSAPLVQWFLNGSLAQTGKLITLRPAGSGEGSASLSLTTSSGGSSVSQEFSLLFGQEKSTNLFGL